MIPFLILCLCCRSEIKFYSSNVAVSHYLVSTFFNNTPKVAESSGILFFAVFLFPVFYLADLSCRYNIGQQMINRKILDPTVLVLPCSIVFSLVQPVVRSAELLQSLQNTLSDCESFLRLQWLNSGSLSITCGYATEEMSGLLAFPGFTQQLSNFISHLPPTSYFPL